MALFGGKESKEDKAARKEYELLAKYGLTDIDAKDIEQVKSINSALLGNKLIEAGTILGGSGVDSAKLTYLRALVEQNWIIIRQLDRLNKNLEGR